ncbi:MAG: DNA polymerase III subunit chi [Candidatus Eutrophobiaceae bacterium]
MQQEDTQREVKSIQRADFYIPPASERSFLDFACKLSDRIRRTGLRLHLHAANEEQAHSLDQLLWSFSPLSFMPHQLLQAKQTPEERMTIGFHANAIPDHSEAIINLAASLPDALFFFSRIAELIFQEDDCLKQAAREHWKQYKTRGIEVHNHDLTRNQGT